MKKSTSAERYRQAQRTLAQQQSFVQDLKESRSKMNAGENNVNLDNILTSSIQRAKQKITNMQSRGDTLNHSMNKGKQQMNRSKDKKEKSSDNVAVVGAMKKLQQRVTSLQRTIQEKQNLLKIQTIQIESLNSEKKVIISGLEEAKRKNINYESSGKKIHSEVNELRKKNEILQKQLKKRLIAENSQKKEEKESKLKQKLSNSEMMHKAKTQELQLKIVQLEEKERGILSLENTRKEEQIKFQEQIELLKSHNKELELKVKSLESKDKESCEMIKILKEELKKNADENAQTKMHLHKLQQLEDEVEHMRESKRIQLSSPKNSNNNQMKLQILKDELKELKEKHQQLFYSYKNLDQKCRREERQAKNFRSKFWQLKELTKEMIEKVNSLPNATTSQLRYLIVKINKMQAFSTQYYMSTPMKNSRNKSIMNSNSKSRSKSKRKGLNMSDLNLSNNSARSRKSMNSNRSNKSINSNRSVSKSKKKVIMSQKSGLKNVEVVALENKIQEIKKEYKKLVKEIEKYDDEQGREKLNNLIIELQEKSEQLTVLKKKK